MKIKPPVNKAAVKKADEEFYKKHPQRVGKALTNSAADDALRNEWHMLYKKHGGAVLQEGAPVLKSVELGRLDNGGYDFKYELDKRPDLKLFLCIEKAEHRLEITEGYSKSKLPELLKCIGAANGWSVTATNKVKCWLVTEKGGKHVAESEAKDLVCPVTPYDGKLTFLGFKTNKPKLTYPGNGHGRLLMHVSDQRYVFTRGLLRGGQLETDPKKRGFDCTTFPMAVLGAQRFSVQDKYGNYLADRLGGQKCDMEQKKEEEIKAFFADAKKGKTGLYIIFSAGHVMLVKNGMIHEFTYGGYASESAQTWKRYRKAEHGLWWVRKLPAKYAP